jgi:UDP-glucose:(heptosyl)LPS alpha-1,3-glucosyltransferase
MNIAFLAKRFDTIGGTERDLYELAAHLAQRGHIVHVYCPEIRANAPTGVQIHRIPQPLPFRIGRLWSVAHRGSRLVDEGGHDLTVSYARTLRSDVVRCGGGTHRGFLREMDSKQGILRRVLRRFDLYHRLALRIESSQFAPSSYRAVVAISPVVKQDIMQQYAVPEDKLHVIYDGVDIEAFRGSPDDAIRASLRARYGIPVGAPVVLFVGNAFHRKGLDTLIAAARLWKHHDAHLLVVGRDPAEQAFRRQASDNPTVHFAGAQSDPRPFYAAADVLALPSRHEAFGNVVIEALSSGLPVVVSRRAGAASILTGRLASLVVDDPENTRQVADRIDAALDDTPDTWRNEAIALARHYSIEAHVTAMEKLFEQLLREKRTGSGQP